MLKTIEILNAILDNSPDGIILISPEYKVIAYNKTFENRLFSLSGRQIKVGDDSREIVIPENKDLYLTNFAKTLTGENVILQSETTIDKTSTWFEYRLNPVYNTTHELIGVTLTAKDIDREKKGEIELAKLSETIKAVFENTTESIILIDKNLTILSFNKAAFNRIKNYNNKELVIGADFKNFLYSGKEHVFYEMFANAIDGQVYTSEVELTDLQGNSFWFKTRLQPIYKPNNELLGIAIFTHHTTESKLSQIALQENEEKFKKIVESTPTPIVIADENMNIMLVNSETVKVFGYTSEELHGVNIRLLIPKHFSTKDKKNGNSLINNLNTPEINKHSSSVTKTGKEILIEIGLSTFVLNNKKYIIAIVQDVTQRIKYEEQIASQLKKLQAIAWQQSHEIRRPLSNILGIFDLLKLEPDATDAEKQKYLDLLYQSAQELDFVIHNIVDHTT